MTVDLFRPFIAPEAAALVAKTLTPDADGRVYVGEGPRVQEFEAAFGRLVGGTPRPPLALNSCTSALELALYLCGVRLGTDVVSTPMTCTATSGAIVRNHGTIIWADVDPITGLIDPKDVIRKLTRRTKAIMAVDWAGRSCDYNALKKFGLPVIQDAAHNIMVDPDNRGDYVCWSLGPIKHLFAGDGGAILPPTYSGRISSGIEQYERVMRHRWHGLDRTSSADFRCAQTIEEAGWKIHMSDISASIGLANLPHVPRIVGQQRANAEWYSRALAGAPGIMLPPPDPTGSAWLYCILTADRQSLIDHLTERGIASSQVHRRNDVQPAYHYPNGPLPGVDAFDSRSLAIPVGWWVTEADREKVAGAVIEWAQSRVQTKELVHG